MKLTVTIVGALTLAAPAAAQTQADLNRRSASSFQAADAALNAQYRRTMALMAVSDKERAELLRQGTERSDGAPGYRAGLLAAQRAWLGYRDAHCTVAGFEFRGGSAQGMARGQCLTDLTRRRTAELRQLQESLGPK